MRVTVRQMRPEEARAFLEVHHAAVRVLAARDYPAEVIRDWAPHPIADSHVEHVRRNPDGEYRLVAERDGHVVGVAALVAENEKLRACYVAPQASRRGVGSALLGEIECAARALGLEVLNADASLTAEPFYAAHRYAVLERSEHILNSGRADGLREDAQAPRHAASVSSRASGTFHRPARRPRVQTAASSA